MDSSPRIPLAQGLRALSPMLVFLISYVAVSVWIGDFYKMPISVALTLASAWGIAIYTAKPLSEKIELFTQAAGHTNILYMIWVFILAGAFANVAGEIGAVDATVRLTLSVFPSSLVVPTIFFAACFISLAIGTSVGTVVALTPLAAEMAHACGANPAFFVAGVLGGAFFGDNLSFISDTTIASTRSQGCDLSDKFKANIRICLPAALITLGFYLFTGFDTPLPPQTGAHAGEPLWLMTPYLIVIGAAALGVNVLITLAIGLTAAIIAGLISGHSLIRLAGYMGAGIGSMGDLIVITLLAAGMLGLIKAMGGITFILQTLTPLVRGPRGAQVAISAIVGIVNLCTANNTVAIITVGSLARKISERYGIAPRKTASLLDTASCIVQSLLPYGAQALLAASLAGISPVAAIPYLYYPMILTATVAISILLSKTHKE